MAKRPAKKAEALLGKGVNPPELHVMGFNTKDPETLVTSLKGAGVNATVFKV